MYFHSQNIHKADHDNKLVNWRCWLGQTHGIRLQIVIPSGDLRLMGSINQESECFHLSIGMILFTLYLTYKNPWLSNKLKQFTKRKDLSYDNGREFGFYWYHHALWFFFWCDLNESRGSDPWLTKMHVIHFDDLLFGKAKYEKISHRGGQFDIPMPEGPYHAKYTISLEKWTRPRSPFILKREIIEIEVPGGIPHDGKGENAWDCGMDATMSWATEFTGSLYDAANKLAFSVLKERAKYGNLSSPEYAKWRTTYLKEHHEKHE